MAKLKKVSENEDIQELLNMLLELAKIKIKDDGLVIPLGATMPHNGTPVFELALAIGSNSEIRDNLVKTMSKMASAGHIRAAGICHNGFLNEIGKFIAVSIEHQNGTNIAVVLRYSENADGTVEFDDDLLIQTGAYTFFKESKPPTKTNFEMNELEDILPDDNELYFPDEINFLSNQGKLLAKTLLQMGTDYLEKRQENRLPMGAMFLSENTVSIVGTEYKNREEIVDNLSKKAKKGRIKVAGICSVHSFSDYNLFLINIQEPPGTSIDIVMRYSEMPDNTIKFYEDTHFSKGAYTLDFNRNESMENQIVGVWQLTGIIDPSTGLRAPWQDGIAPTVELYCYLKDHTFHDITHFEEIETIFDNDKQQFSFSNEDGVIHYHQGNWEMLEDQLTENSERDGKPKQETVRIISITDTEMVIEEPAKLGVKLQVIYTRRSDLIKGNL